MGIGAIAAVVGMCKKRWFKCRYITNLAWIVGSLWAIIGFLLAAVVMSAVGKAIISTSISHYLFYLNKKQLYMVRLVIPRIII